MKPVYKCDYCNFMGTKEEVEKHEPDCTDNYDMRSCHTCKHKRTDCENHEWFFTCAEGIAIPKGQFFKFCKSHERKEKSENLFGSLFGDLFGGFSK